MSWKIKIYVLAIIFLGILPLIFKGIQLGMDFKGGTMIQIKLERPVSEWERANIISVMQSRLNSYGLRDIHVRPWGNNFIVVEVAETNPDVINQIESLIGQQGKFETLFEGKTILTGSDIVSVITNPQQGYGIYPVGNGYKWQVPFVLTSDAAYRFADAVKGKCTYFGGDQCKETVYMFIDRPAGSIVIVPKEIYEREKEIPEDFMSSQTKVSFEQLMKNANISYIIFNGQDICKEIEGKTVIVPSNFSDPSLKCAAKVIKKDKVGNYWIVDAIDLQNIVHLTPGVTMGSPVKTPSISGFAQTKERAMAELKKVEILLKSGKLPVSVSVSSVTTISPTLGKDFIKFIGLAGLIALLTVAIVVAIRYREPKITALILLTSFSEIIIILGIASLINWQLDLPSFAGIIAAIGTGVDHQIIITDESKRGEERLSIIGRIKRAFSIILMAAFTTISAMIPLAFLGLGTLKGFAFTTILGCLIGVLITRPAYGELIKVIMK